MPEKYDHEQDGKLYTRYSELRLCTPKGVYKVIENRKFGFKEANPYTHFGTLRHEVFAEGLRKRGVLPSVFNLKLDQKLEIDQNLIEKSYGIEVWENVVIYMTPDLHNKTWVADFKTTTRGIDNYRLDKQTLFYAWLLNKIGYSINKGYYLCERWDIDRTQIQGYEVLEKKITNKDIEYIEGWAKLRVERLYSVLSGANYGE